MANMPTADAAIRELLANEVLRPAVIERALDRALEVLARRDDERARTRRPTELRKQLADVERSLSNLAGCPRRGLVALRSCATNSSHERAVHSRRFNPDSIVAARS